MKKTLKRRDLLKMITNISEKFCDKESDPTNFEQLSSEYEVAPVRSETSESKDNNEDSITEDEHENFINIHRKRCRI